MARREKLLLCLITITLAFVLNRAFLDWVTLDKIMAMNDVEAIMHGYRQTPNLLVDGLRWWHGTWIEQHISAYRPLASYLYWLESWLGLHYGFVWVGIAGVLLLAVNALLAGVLAWRLTRWKSCVFLAALLSVALRFFNWVPSTPDYWLAWYPIHQELMMNALLLGAIISFDVWVETTERKYFIGAWMCFVLGALTKEHVYIFPTFALAVGLLRRNEARVPLSQSLLQSALMAAGVLALWFFRAGILVDPRNPHLKIIHLIRKPWLYLFYPFYKSVLCEEFWFAGLSVFIFFLSGVLIYSRSRTGRAWLQKPMRTGVVLFGYFGLLAAYCGLTYGSAIDAAWYLFDPANNALRAHHLAAMIATLYTLWLLWKYRKTEPTALAFTLLALSYVPVITYLGWHYTVAAWFVRSAYWALVFKLVWLDVSPVVLSRLPKFLLQFPFVARLKSSPA
jgi:hypothetical protein